MFNGEMFWKISGWISIFLVSAKFTILIIFIYFIATGWLGNTYCYRVFQLDFKILRQGLFYY